MEHNKNASFKIKLVNKSKICLGWVPLFDFDSSHIEFINYEIIDEHGKAMAYNDFLDRIKKYEMPNTGYEAVEISIICDGEERPHMLSYRMNDPIKKISIRYGLNVVVDDKQTNNVMTANGPVLYLNKNSNILVDAIYPDQSIEFSLWNYEDEMLDFKDDEISNDSIENEEGWTSFEHNSEDSLESLPHFFDIKMSNVSDMHLENVQCFDFFGANKKLVDYSVLQDDKSSYLRLLDFIKSYDLEHGVEIYHFLCFSSNAFFNPRKLSFIKHNLSGGFVENIINLSVHDMQEQKSVVAHTFVDNFPKLNVGIDLVIDRIEANETLTFRFYVKD